MSELYVGLMSGTSMDGIDAALVEFNNHAIKLVASHSHAIPLELKEKLHHLSHNSDHASIDMLGEADTELGKLFADATLELLKKSAIDSSSISAIGSHGQTIRHRPDLTQRFTLQIADPNQISYLTGITTIADFRRKDMAAKGEGAPLAPTFHRQVFYHPDENRAVLNIGGISNLTFLPKDNTEHCFGFDCGPGNGLMDAWVQLHKQKPCDYAGEWAASSEPDLALTSQLMLDDFIHLAPPKSTGKEHYHLAWLNQQLAQSAPVSADVVQASLCQFTSDSIIHAVNHYLPEIDRLIVCGGGVHNTHLMQKLQNGLGNIKVESSALHGVQPDWVEAIAFAWLARQTQLGQTGNLPGVTGAERELILGAIYPA